METAGSGPIYIPAGVVLVHLPLVPARAPKLCLRTKRRAASFEARSTQPTLDSNVPVALGHERQDLAKESGIRGLVAHEKHVRWVPAVNVLLASLKEVARSNVDLSRHGDRRHGARHTCRVTILTELSQPLLERQLYIFTYVCKYTTRALDPKFTTTHICFKLASPLLNESTILELEKS